MNCEVKRTKAKSVTGLTIDSRESGVPRIRMKEIVFRITSLAEGKSISLADEKRGIMLEIPLEPVEDLIFEAYMPKRSVENG